MKSKGIFFAPIIIFLMLFGCQSKAPSTLPNELLGVWKTAEPKYTDCAFILKEGFIIYLSGDLLENIDVNFISSVEEIPKNNTILYVLQCKKSTNQDFKVSLHYDPSRHAIRFKNQNRIEWKKDKNAKY
jgi:hypothetical protein